MTTRPALAAIVCTLCAPSLSFAQMHGEELLAEWRYPEFGHSIESHLITVGDGTELTESDIRNSSSLSIDVSDTEVRFRATNASEWLDEDFNGWYFEDVHDALPPIVGYELLRFSGDGELRYEAGWEENAFWADFSGTHVEFRDVIVMRVLFVPGPAPLGALGGAALLAMTHRRRPPL